MKHAVPRSCAACQEWRSGAPDRGAPPGSCWINDKGATAAAHLDAWLVVLVHNIHAVNVLVHDLEQQGDKGRAKGA